jgi:predicted nuclease with TOPRIM domain
MTRDLKDDLNRFRPSTLWVDAPITKEWLERAIAAEKLAKERYNENKLIFSFLKTTESQNECHVETILQLKDEKSHLAEENDIQRASIQELSKQVAEMQSVVDAAKEIALFGAITNEKQVNSFMRKVATLGKALQNLEAAHEQ